MKPFRLRLFPSRIAMELDPRLVSGIKCGWKQPQTVQFFPDTLVLLTCLPIYGATYLLSAATPSQQLDDELEK